MNFAYWLKILVLNYLLFTQSNSTLKQLTYLYPTLKIFPHPANFTSTGLPSLPCFPNSRPMVSTRFTLSSSVGLSWLYFRLYSIEFVVQEVLIQSVQNELSPFQYIWEMALYILFSSSYFQSDTPPSWTYKRKKCRFLKLQIHPLHPTAGFFL